MTSVSIVPLFDLTRNRAYTKTSTRKISCTLVASPAIPKAAWSSDSTSFARHFHAQLGEFASKNLTYFLLWKIVIWIIDLMMALVFTLCIVSILLSTKIDFVLAMDRQEQEYQQNVNNNENFAVWRARAT